MKRMATLASQSSSGGEFQAKVTRYKEESEKEDINEVRFVMLTFLRISTEH
jgi:hypothetical protein